jgi:hypothetical protein
MYLFILEMAKKRLAKARPFSRYTLLLKYQVFFKRANIFDKVHQNSSTPCE